MTSPTRIQILVAALGLTLAGCAATDSKGRSKPATYRWAETESKSRAPGAAYAGAAMFPRVPMPDRRDFHDWEFFYKHCSRVDADRPYVSKSQYDCNGPY